MSRFERDFGQLGFTTGLRLAAVRRIMGFTQADLAGATGLSRSHIAMLETDRRRLTLATAERLGSSLGVSVFDLLAVVVGERTDVEVIIERDWATTNRPHARPLW